MQKILSALLAISFLILSSTSAFAIEASPTAKRVETQAKKPTKLETVKEKLASREAQLKAKLEKFKDKNKAEKVEKISLNLNMINKKHTDQMSKFLDNAERILDKLESREGSASAIESAREEIDSARKALKQQADKDYTIAVSSESSVKIDAKSQRDKLLADLKSVRELVRDAKKAVAGAIQKTATSKENK